jgi:pimeloyl-ACP methyl ester carboxylesterase
MCVPFVTVNGARFHYELDDFTDPWADADTIVIQHGFGRSGRFWYPWVPYLARDYRVIRRDMRGHGQSEDPGPDYDWTVDGLLSDLHGFLDALGLESVHYVGESVAAMHGVGFASRWPERFKTMTLCSMPIAIWRSWIDSGSMSVDSMKWNQALDELGVGGWAEAQMVPGMFAGLDGPEERRRWLVQEWDKTPRHVATRLQDAMMDFNIEPLLSEVTVPTLVLAPTRSALQPLETQVSILEQIPGARIATVDGPGHEAYFDRPVDCVTAVRRFIESVGA